MDYTRFVLFILVVIRIEYCSGGMFYIGAIFDGNEKLNSAMLRYAVKKANEQILNGSNITLGEDIQFLDYSDDFLAAQSACYLMERQNSVIIGPKSPSASAHIANICDAKEVPYIDTYMDIEVKSSTVNLYPSLSTLSDLLIELVNAYQWKDFTVIYEAPLFVTHFGALVQDRNKKPGIVTVQPIEVDTDFRDVLQKIRNLGSRSENIIIECSIERLEDILQKALQVGLFTPERNVIITNLDAHTIDLEPYKYTQANITLFRVFDQQLKNELDEERKICESCLEERNCAGHQSCRQEDIDELDVNVLPTSVALIYDAITILAKALEQIGYEHLQAPQIINCMDPLSTFSKGSTVTNFMRTCNFKGLTGLVEFDTKGSRSNVQIDVLSLSTEGLNEIGMFKPMIYSSNTTTAGQITFTPQPVEATASENRPINEMTLNVVIAISDPYIMFKDTTEQLIGNDFEGFGIDIIEVLSRLYGFKYNFVLQKGSDYGSYNNVTDTWSGMIGKVRSEVADLAITDLTINSERITGLDFTPSFMNLGIAILYLKPSKAPPKMFSFMDPFSSFVWIFLGAAYITVSLCFFCLGRISASQWENRYPCVEEPTFLENQFTLNNSMWFAAGALLQQGSEIEPKSASIRLASSFWWFFTLIMVSSYTANLASFLVVENKVSNITSVTSFYKCLNDSTVCPAKFGAKRGGATHQFFNNPNHDLYMKMFKYMNETEGVLTGSNEEGISKVENENYAFLMESSSIEYVTERRCSLGQVGKPLDDKNYGIGMRKNYTYHSILSEGVLQLQERGVLASLRKKWWTERKGGGACSDNSDEAAAVALQMANIVGIFYVLIIGISCALLYGIIDFVWLIRKEAEIQKKNVQSDAEELEIGNLKGVFLVLLCGSIFATLYGCSDAILHIYKQAKSEKISFKEELKAEIDFLLTCQGVKQVRHRKGSKSQGSNSSSRSSGKTNSHIHRSNTILNME